MYIYAINILYWHCIVINYMNASNYVQQKLVLLIYGTILLLVSMWWLVSNYIIQFIYCKLKYIYSKLNYTIYQRYITIYRATWKPEQIIYIYRYNSWQQPEKTKVLFLRNLDNEERKWKRILNKKIMKLNYSDKLYLSIYIIDAIGLWERIIHHRITYLLNVFNYNLLLKTGY